MSFLSDARQLTPMTSDLADSILVLIGHTYCDHLNQGGSIAPIIQGSVGVPLNADIGLDTPVSVPLGEDENPAVLAAAIHNYCPSYRTAFETAWRTPGRFLLFRPGTPQRVKELNSLHLHQLLSYLRTPPGQ